MSANTFSVLTAPVRKMGVILQGSGLQVEVKPEYRGSFEIWGLAKDRSCSVVLVIGARSGKILRASFMPKDWQRNGRAEVVVQGAGAVRRALRAFIYCPCYQCMDEVA